MKPELLHLWDVVIYALKSKFKVSVRHITMGQETNRDLYSVKCVVVYKYYNTLKLYICILSLTKLVFMGSYLYEVGGRK